MLSKVLPRIGKKVSSGTLLGKYMESFCCELITKKYTIKSITAITYGLNRLLKDIHKEGIFSLQDLTENVIQEYWRSYRNKGNSNAASACKHLIAFCKKHDIHLRESKSKISIIDSEVNNFCDYLQSALGYAPHTIESCRLYVLRFLEDQFSKYPSASIWDNLRLSDVNEFIVKSSKIMNRYSLQHVIGYLRSYLKYKFQQGCLKQMIHEQIDSPVVFREEKIPKASSWTVIKEILLSIDRSTSCGCRNYAIILLAARYGLRSNEISFLRICDIKWREKRICIPQSKTKQTNVLPLSNDVAWAIIDYVKNFRPHTRSEFLFLREKPPYEKLWTGCLRDILKWVKKTSGNTINFPKGSHWIRHTVAMELIKRGVGFKQVGDLLGHIDPDSTNVYIRLNIDELRCIPLEVPSPLDIPSENSTRIPVNKLRKKKIKKIHLYGSSGIFGGAIQSYIDLQKSLGKEFNRGNSVLREFDYLIAEKFNNTWKPEYFEYILTHFSYLSKSVFRRTILIIRNFLVYYSRENDNIFVPSTHMLPREEKSKVAYIISQKDIAKCLSSLKQLPSWTGQQMRAESSYMGIVLLYTCGLRINEMRQLRLRDFSFENQSLFIRKTKFHKERLIPVSKSVADELQYYLCIRNKIVGTNPNDPLICVFRKGHKLSMYYGISDSWRIACIQNNVKTNKGTLPRIHDLRHSFAVHCLMQIYKNNHDVSNGLVYLSTYMGHVCIASTYYYLNFIPELSEYVNKNFEKAYGTFQIKGEEA